MNQSLHISLILVDDLKKMLGTDSRAFYRTIIGAKLCANNQPAMVSLQLLLDLKTYYDSKRT